MRVRPPPQLLFSWKYANSDRVLKAPEKLRRPTTPSVTKVVTVVCSLNRMKEKPPKPYRDFPLYSHRNGQWAKKIRGKTRFFGTWNSWRDALKEYELSKGVEPTSDAFDLQDLVNLFLHAKQKAADSGEILQDTHKEYARVCARDRKSVV